MDFISSHKIFLLYHPADTYTAEVVEAALTRSFTSAQVQSCTYGQLGATPEAAVLINPDEQQGHLLRRLKTGGRKVLVLGRIGHAVGAELGITLRKDFTWEPSWGSATVDHGRHHNESPAVISYAAKHPLGSLSPLSRRPLCRYDFQDEWNNLGFGPITVGGGPWSLAAAPGGKPIGLGNRGRWACLSAYATLLDTQDGATLWINRPVGVVDSVEWRMVEGFFGEYRADELNCFPYVGEIPSGYAGAVTMRLDCDEAVATAEPLFELYASRGVPFSLAVTTGQRIEERDLRLLRAVMAAGGAVVTHSVHHFPNWGSSYGRAREEAAGSRSWLEEHLPEAGPVRYAVSPFHQNPVYALEALADAGYQGFIGGIIRNDPEFLLGRAGRIPFVPSGLVSHSQQCMLHGDCYRRYGQTIDVYLQSFHNHGKGQAIFGYLDHPFSARYQYGWDTEQERIRAHEQLLDHICSQDSIWKASLNDCLDFLRKRDGAVVGLDEDGTLRVENSVIDALPPLAIRWKGQTIPC